MTIAELDAKIQELRELRSAIDQLTAEADAIVDTVKAQMTEQGEEELSGNGWKATWHAVTTSRFDAKALKADDPDTYARYCRSSTVCRFCLT